MKRLSYLILIVLTISCNIENKTNNEIQNFNLVITDSVVYEIINKIICDSIYNPDLISLETPFVSKTIDSTYESGDPPPPPPPPGVICYDSYFWNNFKDKGIFDSLDIKSMKTQIEPIKKMNWDSLKLNTKVFSQDSVFEMIKSNKINDFYVYIKEKYKANNYISVSVPLYSVDKTKVLLSVEQYCGYTCGGGSIYVFEKIKNKWTIIFNITTWISENYTAPNTRLVKTGQLCAT